MNKQVVAKTKEIEAAEKDENATEAAIDKLKEEKNELRHQELSAIEWKQLWAKPAIFALIVLVVFVVLFYDRSAGGSGDLASADGGSQWQEHDDGNPYAPPKPNRDS